MMFPQTLLILILCRIKRNSLIAPIVDGGIGIIDIITKLKSLKSYWINRLLKKSCTNRIFLDELCKMKNVNFDIILKTNETNLKDFEMICKLPKFYQEIFLSFNECKKIIFLK